MLEVLMSSYFMAVVLKTIQEYGIMSGKLARIASEVVQLIKITSTFLSLAKLVLSLLFLSVAVDRILGKTQRTSFPPLSDDIIITSKTHLLAA